MSDTISELLSMPTQDSGIDACKGFVFRCRVSDYMSDCVVTNKVTMRKLKRKSCPGCAKCWPLYDDLIEFVAAGTIQYPENPENGALYTLEYRNISTDWETGYVDDYDLAFVLMEGEDGGDK